jgi:hypothetical protein
MCSSSPAVALRRGRRCRRRRGTPQTVLRSRPRCRSVPPGLAASCRWRRRAAATLYARRASNCCDSSEFCDSSLGPTILPPTPQRFTLVRPGEDGGGSRLPSGHGRPRLGRQQTIPQPPTTKLRSGNFGKSRDVAASSSAVPAPTTWNPHFGCFQFTVTCESFIGSSSTHLRRNHTVASLPELLAHGHPAAYEHPPLALFHCSRFSTTVLC